MRKWFSDLKVVHKLMLMSIFFLLPDSIMLCLMLSGINDNIEFAQQEIRGNEYLVPLVHLLHLLPEHQHLARSPGDAAAADQLAPITRQIDQCLASLTDIDRRYASDMQFTDEALKERDRAQARPSFLISDWNQLRTASIAAQPPVTAPIYQHLLKNIRDMIAHVGDMSNLILDPDLDTYYLMDAVLLSIPQDQDQVVRAIDSGETALQRSASIAPENPNPAGDSDAPLAEMYATLLQSDLDHVVNSVKTALREDSDFYGTSETLQRRVPPRLDAYVRDMAAFIELTKTLNRAGVHPTLTAAQYRLAGTRARVAGITLWEVSSQELGNLLQMRIGYYQRHRLLGLSITALAVLSASLLITFINRSINTPLKRAATELRELNAKLSAEVNEKLHAQSDLIEASHRSGMAEIATGVLHNVGNVLNSVNTSATVIRERLDRSKIPTLSRAGAMIQDHQADAAEFLANDPKGRQLPELLCLLAETMAADQNLIADELGQLTRNIEHIRQIVQAQQLFAKGPAQTEEFDLAEMIEDVLRMTGLARGAYGIELTRDFHPCNHAFLDRHKVLQIMVNLISNARKAVMESEDAKKQITISLEPVIHPRAAMARILVADNGVGISAENLEKIFQHGFTTRKDGHGFGLHTAILDAHEMGGSITVCSSGPGAGATFMLEIPLAQTAAKKESEYESSNSHH